jgi:hypothetical protein
MCARMSACDTSNKIAEFVLLLLVVVVVIRYNHPLFGCADVLDLPAEIVTLGY